MSKVVVTGGAGFIGSHLVDALLSQGNRVLVIDDLSTGNKEYLHPEVDFLELDICKDKTAQEIKRFKPNQIFHLAAQKNLRYSLEHPDEDANINIIGSIKLLEAAREIQVEKFLFASTGGAIYDADEARPTPETGLAAPISPYGIGKRAFEYYLSAYTKVYKMPSAALRLANVYGPRQDPKGEAGVVAIFIDHVLHNRSPQINGDGSQTRDFVFVSDVVRAFIAAADSDRVGIFNVGTSQETSISQLWSLIKDSMHSDLEAKHGPEIPGELMASSLDVQKSAKELNWGPSIDVAMGINETVSWFFKQQKYAK
ncbi:MAG: NAD-dependent epimerase/dehydratase family protein [Candidatus Nomurabacteria bacterium]|nr:MAG: NAD-dependent epimerase/dehydratase family protein [Candidatus Nomurabacteria bacterium]